MDRRGVNRRGFLKAGGGATAGLAVGGMPLRSAHAADVPDRAPDLTLNVAIAGGSGGLLATAHAFRGLLDAFAVTVQGATGGRIAINISDTLSGTDRDHADVLLAFGDHGARYAEPLSIFGGMVMPVGRAAPTTDIISSWLFAAGAYGIWEQLAFEAGWKPLPLGILGGSDLVLSDISTAGPAHRAGLARVSDQSPSLADWRAGAAIAGLSLTDLAQLPGVASKAAQDDLRLVREPSASTGTIIAAFVRNRAWDALSGHDQLIFELAARATLSTHAAQRLFFEREVLPTLPIATLAIGTGSADMTHPHSESDAAQGSRAALAAMSERDPYVGALLSTFDRLIGDGQSPGLV